MTDKEIIKASENLLFSRNCKIAKSGEQFITLGDILDLINRQQAKIEALIEDTLCLENTLEENESLMTEIEGLTINMNAFGLGMKREKERADTARAEAIKEFADRLKEKEWLIFFHKKPYKKSFYKAIDDIIKEMVGEDK